MPLWSLCPARFFSLLSLGRTLFWYSSLIHSSPRCRQSGGEEAGLTSELAVTFVKFGFTAALFRIFFPCNLFLNLSLISSSFFSSCVCTQNYTILDFSQTCIKTWNEILLKSKNKTLKYLKLKRETTWALLCPVAGVPPHYLVFPVFEDLLPQFCFMMSELLLPPLLCLKFPLLHILLDSFLLL